MWIPALSNSSSWWELVESLPVVCKKILSTHVKQMWLFKATLNTHILPTLCYDPPCIVKHYLRYVGWHTTLRRFLMHRWHVMHWQLDKCIASRSRIDHWRNWMASHSRIDYWMNCMASGSRSAYALPWDFAPGHVLQIGFAVPAGWSAGQGNLAVWPPLDPSDCLCSGAQAC